MAGFVTYTSGTVKQFHVGDRDIKHSWRIVDSIQVDGDELIRSVVILSRNSTTLKLHTFTGEAAKEIIANWY
mgnify:CR=1 FL=1